MKKNPLYVIVLFMLLAASSYAQNRPPKTIMLVLGSDNLPILQHRIDVAYQLYTVKPFDRIIVSGGCGAHNSTLCEASEMKRLLLQKGVPEALVVKEEKSKTTVQNYVYSRVLEDSTGHRIIQPGDTVYVVSDHWHAIAVAGRLNRYDGVTAFFHIEGNLQPRENDKVDYASILYGEPDNERFVRKALWPWVDAAYRKNGTLYLLMGSLLFSKPAGGSETVQSIAEAFPGPAIEQADAAFYEEKNKELWLVQKDSLFRISFTRKKIVRQPATLLRSWIRQLPPHWYRLDAMLPVKDTLYIFHGDEMVAAHKKGKTYTAQSPVKIGQKIAALPFNWGGGYLDAADFDPATQTITLYKAKEQLALNPNFAVVDQKAKPLSLPWPARYFGERK